jgi:predicted TIM-barrel fold metal-dependent hydrolase
MNNIRMPLSTIDCHFHIFDLPSAHSGAAWRYRPTAPATLAQWRAHASARGVARGVVVQPSFLGADNSLLLGALCDHLHALRGVVVIDPFNPSNDWATMRASGVRGVRFNVAGVAAPAQRIRDVPAAVWDALLAHDLHVELHADVGCASALVPLVPSSLTLVLDHLGKPRADLVEETIFAHARARGVGKTWVKLSAPYRQAKPNDASFLLTMCARWLDAVGDARIVWGSDWPFTQHEDRQTYEMSAQWLSALPLNAAQREAIFSRNPVSLYWR